MIRLAWRQFRTSAVVAGAALVAVGAVCALTGPHLVHLFRTTVALCRAGSDCTATNALFLRQDNNLRTWLGVLVIVVPAITGVFWGAPLVAGELDRGTFRLAWTQSVTRTRWLATKLAVIGLASVAMPGLLSLMVGWWAGPLDRVRLDQFATFDQRGIVPLGYAAFAFMLGAAAGVLIRHPLPAMATTMVAFVTARLTFIHMLRPHLLAPLVRAVALDPVSTGFGSSGSLFSGGGPDSLQPVLPTIPDGWITSSRIIDRGGHPLTSQILNAACPNIGGGGPPAGASGGHGPVPAAVQQGLQDCVAKIGATFHQAVSYQPASRYWTLQWYELAIYLGAALLLGAAALWWVRRLQR